LFPCNGVAATNLALPFKNMRMARLDGSHCYLFGGDNAGNQQNVLSVGVDGTVSNLFSAPQPVTAVAGNGIATFVAMGDIVFFMGEKTGPRVVFREVSPIFELALAPSNGVFYATSDGVGCIDGPNSGLIFLRKKILSMDCRRNRLLLLTTEQEVKLIEPVADFPQTIRAVQDVLLTSQSK
jgi:hypothetical protein